MTMLCEAFFHRQKNNKKPIDVICLHEYQSVLKICYKQMRMILANH